MTSNIIVHGAGMSAPTKSTHIQKPVFHLSKISTSTFSFSLLCIYFYYYYLLNKGMCLVGLLWSSREENIKLKRLQSSLGIIITLQTFMSCIYCLPNIMEPDPVKTYTRRAFQRVEKKIYDDMNEALLNEGNSCCNKLRNSSIIYVRFNILLSCITYHRYYFPATFLAQNLWITILRETSSSPRINIMTITIITPLFHPPFSSFLRRHISHFSFKEWWRQTEEGNITSM